MKFNRLFLLGIASIFAYMPYPCSGLIIETIDSIMYEKVTAELQRVNHKTLVVFDMDNTLFAVANGEIVTAIDQKITLVPIEEKMIEIIKNLQDRHIKVIALTASGATPEIRRWRVCNLHQIGLDFSHSFALKESIFNRLPQWQGVYSAFYHGVLCTAHNPKGPVLAAFLDRVAWRPDKVIFFDDQFQHCVGVAHEMTMRGIPVQCYWYRAAYNKRM